MAGYSRQSLADIISGAVIKAAPVNAEFNAIRDSFAFSGGHKHDGSSTEGAYIPLIADVDGKNKVVVDTANNRISFYTEVSGTATEQLRIQDGAIVPVTDNDIDLGSAGAEFKDLYVDGIGYIDSVVITGGTIDGTAIGGNTPAAGAFTTLTSTGAASFNSMSVTGSSTLPTVDINAGTIDGTAIGNSSTSTGRFTTLNTSGQATLASADINGGTVDDTVIGGTTAAAITGTIITATTGITGDVDGDVTGNLTGNVTGNVTGDLTGDVTGNITAASGTSTVNNLTVNGTLDVTGTTIANVVDPVNAQDAATKNYVDTSVAAVVDAAPAALDTLNELAAALGDDASFSTTVTNSIATKLPLSGGNMSGAIAMGDNKVTGVATPTSTADAATKGYTDTQDALKLNLTGGTLTGNLVMGGNKVTSTATPTADSDLTRKAYVDSILGSATSAATSAAAAATSASNAATSETNAATSETNAAASETAAASSAAAASTSAAEAAASAASIDTDNIDINGGTIDGTVIGGTTPAAGNFTTGSFTGNATFGDNDKAIFGAGSDLQIYHDGGNSYVRDAGAGSLLIRATDLYLQDTYGGNYLTGIDSTGEVALWHDSDAKKLATTSTGIDVTGTVTADGLTVDPASGNGLVSVKGGSTNSFAYLRLTSKLSGVENYTSIFANYSADITFQHDDGRNLAKFASNGDISFYEDTGTTPKFFWDASAEALGIGTSSPDQPLSVVGKMSFKTGAATRGLVGSPSWDGSYVSVQNGTLAESAANAALYQNATGETSVNAASGKSLLFKIANGEKARIDASGNLGIGTSSPLAALSVGGGSLSDANLPIQISTGASGNRYVGINKNGAYALLVGYEATADQAEIRNIQNTPIVFKTNDAERMRIDSSGNLEMTGGGSVGWANWTITESGGSLYFATGGTNKMKLDASGNLDVVGSVNANATIT